MSKLLLLIIAIVSVTFLFSCHKTSEEPIGNYNCVCIDTAKGSTLPYVVTIDTFAYPGYRKSVASQACNISYTKDSSYGTCKLY